MDTLTDSMSSRTTPAPPVNRFSDRSFLTARNYNAERDAWQKQIDQLNEWARTPVSYWDNELVPPTYRSLSSAMKLLHQMHERGYAPDFSIVPSGDGGIVFEIRGVETFAAIEVFSDGSAELRHFENSLLMGRRPFGI